MRKAYNFNTNNLISAEPIDSEIVRKRIHNRLGTDAVTVRFRTDADRTPIVDMSTLPNGVQESDVKNAIQKSHPRANGAPT